MKMYRPLVNRKKSCNLSENEHTVAATEESCSKNISVQFININLDY